MKAAFSCPMKKFLAVAVISVGLASCSTTDELRVQCSINTSLVSSGELKKKAQDYIAKKTGLSSDYSETAAFCEAYLK